MASFKELYKPALLSADKLKKGIITGKIVNIGFEQVKGSDGDMKDRIIIELDDEKTRISLNKTNGNILADAYGDETDDWIGKKIKVTTAMTTFMGKPCPGLVLTPVK